MRSFRVLAGLVLAVVLALSSMHNAFAATELYYDDGTSEGYSVSTSVGTRYAIRFSLPSGWSAASLVGVKFYTWDGGSATVRIYGSLTTGCNGVELRSFSMNFNLNSWNERTGLSGIIVTGDFCVAAEYTVEWYPRFGWDTIVAPEVDPQRSWIYSVGTGTWSHPTFYGTGGVPVNATYMIRAWVGPPPAIADLEDFTTLPTNNMTLIVGDIALNPHGSKPAGVNYQQGRDTTPLGFVSGMLANPQPSIFDTNATWINATTGRPFASIPPDLIFSIGGPGINAVTYYYESTGVAGDKAPVRFSYNSTHFWWVSHDGTKVYTDLQSNTAVPPGTSDVFVIQTLKDTDGRQVVLMYGTRYTGTWAAAWWFKFVVYPNIQNYTNSYYVVRWTDATSGPGSDYTPDLGDTYTILAQG